MEKLELTIKNISKSFEKKKIFEDFSIKFSNDSTNIILGESGGGKTTLLNIIAGLLPKDGGEVYLNSKMSISYVFQEDRLLPWLTVKDNLKTTLLKYYDSKTIESEIEKYLYLLKIEEAGDKYPKELSGGMKQRVNIARALLKPSNIILLDEPFKSLDYKTKYLIMDELKKIIKNEKRLIIFVTHDLEEAIFLEGKVYVFGGSPLKVNGVFKENLSNKKKEILDCI